MLLDQALHRDTDQEFQSIVKFDTDVLPPILNALETENGGQKLVLEVAVSLAVLL